MCHNKAKAHPQHEDDHPHVDRLAKDVFRTNAVVKYNAAHVRLQDKECRPEIVQKLLEDNPKGFMVMKGSANDGTTDIGNDAVRLHKDRLVHRYGMRCLGIVVTIPRAVIARG